MNDVHGSCADQFLPLRALLESNLASGEDTGASVAVIHDGELVVDLWGGEAAPGRPWTQDTLVNVWSVTKPMCALTVLVLADRGVLDLDDPVAKHWPEFAAGGKEAVLVRHLLGHTSGVSGWQEPMATQGLYDPATSEALLAAQAPWWEPGTASGYHMINQGHLLDGLVYGATGRRLGDVLRTEIAEPLGADFHIGLGDTELSRVATSSPPPPLEFDLSTIEPDGVFIKTLANPLLEIGRVVNSEGWRHAQLGGVNGHGNARSVATVQAAVSHGGEANGHRLLGQETLDRIFEVQADGVDQVLMTPMVFGMGWALPTPTAPEVPAGRTCWWTGYGGAVVVNDLDRRTTVAYAMNQMHAHLVTSPRTDGYLRTAFGCL